MIFLLVFLCFILWFCSCFIILFCSGFILWFKLVFPTYASFQITSCLSTASRHRHRPGRTRKWSLPLQSGKDFNHKTKIVINTVFIIDTEISVKKQMFVLGINNSWLKNHQAVLENILFLKLFHVLDIIRDFYIVI